MKLPTTVIDYLYDFGNSWEHRITITDVRPVEPGVSYPRYIAGEWNAPPEDCGGLPGFYESCRRSNHPNHAEAKEWPIDELPINYALSRVANRRNASKTRLANKKQTSSTN